MAAFGKIYSYAGNFRVSRIQAIAALNGLTIELAPDFEFGVTNRTPEYLAKFPLGKVPAFESADGSFLLTEAQAIARYVAESGPRAGQLLGEDAKTRALIEQWACFAEQELTVNVVPIWLMCLLKVVPLTEEKYAEHEAAVERAVKRLEVAVQGGKKFLVGDQLTLADIMVVSVLQLAARLIFDKEMRAQTPGVEAYLKGIMELPEMKEAFPPLELCEARLRGQSNKG